MDYEVSNTADTFTESVDTNAGVFKKICCTSLGIWEKQINNVVGQIKGAIGEMSSKFSALSSNLDAAVHSSQKSTEEVKLDSGQASISISEIFYQTENELGNVLTVLSETQESKRKLVEKFKDFKEFTKQLGEMSDEVATNARMTNILSLNARVEAARSDTNGQGFAVVAQEVRDLAISSAKIGERIADLVSSFDSGMESVIEMAEKNAEEDVKTLKSSKETIINVMEKFKAITESMAKGAKDMHETGQHIQSEISDVLIALQFQDRVSQILENISENMTTLQQQGNEDEQVLDAWFETMQQSYTTEEQKLAHSEHETSAEPESTVTFF